MRKRIMFRGRKRRQPVDFIVGPAAASTGGYNNTIQLNAGGGVTSVELAGVTTQGAIDPIVLSRFKLLAIRGQVLPAFNTAGAVADRLLVRMGIAMIDNNALPPSPGAVADGDVDWLWLAQGNLTITLATTDLATQWAQQQGAAGGTVHVKSKRIVTRDKKLVIVGTMVGIGAIMTTSITFNLFLRPLVTAVA